MKTVLTYQHTIHMTNNIAEDRRDVPNIPMHHRGRIAISRIFFTVSFGVEPVFDIFVPCPKICRSRVSMRAEQPAALALWINRLAKS